jgi:hypothetical protein
MNGLHELKMDASLAAEAFYRAKGFMEIERKMHLTSAGDEIECVVMQKSLGG